MADSHIHVPGHVIGILLSALLACLGSPAFAQDVMQTDLDRCMEIEISIDRLACFEALATRPETVSATGAEKPIQPAVTGNTGLDSTSGFEQTRPMPLPAAPVPPAAPVSTSQGMATPPAPNAEPFDDFGLPKKPATEERDNKTRELVLASAKRDQRGNIVFTMQDGQVWRQTDKAPIIMPSYDDQAVIEKGFPAGFRMRLNKRTIRVERLK